MEVWGDRSPKFICKGFENVEKYFLTKFLQVEDQTPYTLLLLRTCRLPICIMAMKEFTCFIKILKLLCKQEKMIQKSHKSKNLCSSLMEDMETWFRRWDTIHLRHYASIDSSMNKVCFAIPMYHDMGEMWRLTFHRLCYICCM